VEEAEVVMLVVVVLAGVVAWFFPVK
jgi:hypothetical protein